MAKCDSCRGSGECSNCGGSGNGKRQNPHPSKPLVDSETGAVKCLACNGTGKCIDCKGRGQR